MAIPLPLVYKVLKTTTPRLNKEFSRAGPKIMG